MRNTKLWTLHQGLSPIEVRQFDKYLRSPYFNLRKDVIDLHAILVASRASRTPSLQKVFEHIWPKQPYNQQQLRYTMSFLVEHIVKYLVHERIKNDPIQLRKDTVEILHARRLDAIFSQASSKLRTQIDHMAESATKYKLTYQHLQLQKENLYRKEEYDAVKLPEISTALDEFYQLEKLRIFIEAESLSSRQGYHFDSKLSAPLLTILQSNRHGLSPLIRKYLSVYEVLTSKDQLSAFQEAVDILASASDDIAHVHLKELYLLTINAGIKQMNRGKEPFFEKTFQLFKQGLANGALLENGILSSSTYKNITATALRLKEYPWVHQYLLDYKELLLPKNRVLDFQYNMALYHFATRNFDAFGALANQLKSRNVHINCDLRRMYAIMFYEQDSFEVLGHHLDSFKVYLRRHRGKLSYHFKNWNQFISVLQKLLKYQGLPNDLQNVLQVIKDMDFLSSKEWFILQLEHSEDRSDPHAIQR